MNTMSVIHHNDMDGKCAAAIIRSEFIRDYDIQMIECNYDPKHKFDIQYIRPTDTVFIVDFSIDPEEMDKLIDKVGLENIIWIDHHITAIEKYKSYKKDISGLRFVGIAGCELTYLYINGYRLFKEDCVVNTLTGSGEIENIFDIRNRVIPRGIRLVGDWDVFDHNFEESKYIRWASEIKNISPENDDFWGMFMGGNNSGLNELIYQGQTCYKLIQCMSKRTIKNSGTEVVLDDYPTYKCIAVNSSVNFTSILFDDVFNDYHIGIRYFKIPGGIVFSMCRLGLEPSKEINMGKICARYGGGGHQGIGGFTTKDKLPFTFVNE